MFEIRITKKLRTVTYFIFVFIILISIQTKLLADSDTEQSILINRYVFLSSQSTLVMTGGLAGVHETYDVSGHFVLNIDFNACTTFFSELDVNAVTENPNYPRAPRALDPNKVFVMTSLAGVVLNDTRIEFTGKDHYDSEIHLTTTLQDGSLHIVANTVPPPGSADYLIYNLDAFAQRKYSGGTGEPNNPYQISEPNDWVELMNTSTDWNKNFLMTSDIDLNEVSLTPVGNNSTKFTGIFDGNDHTIYNASINMPNNNCIGLFGYLYGKIQNLGLGIGKVIGGYCVGALVGVNWGGTVTQCYSTGIIDGNEYVGGLEGGNFGTLINCYSTGTVNGNSNIGGLVGDNGGTVITCYSTGIVNGRSYFVGGLVGENSDGNVTNCYSTGTVSGNGHVGGLVGDTGDGDVTNCYSTGKVSGHNCVGGLVGSIVDGDVTICYSTSVVDGNNCVGGLVGYNYRGDVTTCYSTGKVSGYSDVGGLVGYNYHGNVNGCFWDIETSCETIGIGYGDLNSVIGKTTIEMLDLNTFLSAGWDFIGEMVNGPNDIWWILEGKDYPRLWWQLPEDDFNDCNAAPLWFPYEMAPEQAHLEEVHGRLEVNTAGAMDDIDAIYAPYNWGLDTNKPFAAKIDFHFSKTGTGDGRVHIGLVPGMDPEAMKWAEFEAGTFDDNPFYLYEVRDGEWVEEQTSARYFNDGTLYVSYDPNSDELYFSNIGYDKKYAFWTVPGLIRGRWQTDSIYIILSGGSEDGLALTGEDAWLDNFKVGKGKIIQ